ncbi:MAG: SMP-30/gluconolactonase/LRE family protein [Flavobacteriaceae bacterium]|nr:SMP-30/gluconolactonase/LRE family protein [Flavobacteriaceae bacterium]
MRHTTLLLLIITTSLLVCCKNNSESNLPSEKIEPVPTTQLEFKIQSQLGEGAFWNHQTNEFYWVDILGKKLHIYNPETKTNYSFSTPSRIGTVVPKNDFSAVVALDDGIYLINTKTGSLEVLSEVEKDLTLNRFNDGKSDPKGNLWVGSMNLKEDRASGSVYKISETGETTKMIDSVTISNGIVWTQDQKTMYYIDTPTAQIRAYDYDNTTATISNERVAVEVSTDLGYPDGMAIDSEDMLWVGLWNGNAVARFNPKTGKLISKIEVPAHNVTACAFGGDNLDKLYITTASVDMTEEEKAKYPLAGSVFVANPGVKGVKSHFFGNAKQPVQ